MPHNNTYLKRKSFLRIRRFKENLFKLLLFTISSLCIFVIAAIIYTLVTESLPFFKSISFKSFFLEKEWTPLFADPKYGIWPLVAGTLTTTCVAIGVALPSGIIIASFLSEFASSRTREWMKPVLEILAGIPTVVYGYFALLFMTPLLQKIFPELPGFNMLSAGLVMGVMIIPYISSLIEDSMRVIPQDLREASFALGASKVETTFKVVLPSASSGVIAALVLSVSRALGETMIVAIAAGMQPRLSFNPMDSGQTLTAFIVQVSLGDAPHGSIGYQSIFVAGLCLFSLTLFLNLIGFYYRRRIRI